MKVLKRRINGILVEYSLDGKPQPISQGLGDKIAAVAQPIAKAIDKIAGTKITGCGGCKKMRERLNAGMSLKNAMLLRIQEAGSNKVLK
jgi:hypothetical protein